MKEMYISLSAAVAQERHLALVANNLANVSSVGFKKETAVFQVRPPQVDWQRMEKSADPALNLPSPRQRIEGDRNYARMAQTVTDFSPGSLRATGNPLDVAIEHPNSRKGAAFFAVETPQGQRLTRAGNFQIDGQSELVTPDGSIVLGKTGGAVKIDRARPESLSVGADGTVMSAGKEVGALRLVWVDEPWRLEKLGNGLYNDGGGKVLSRAVEDTDRTRIRQGFLEYSNVNVVEELVRMIELQRSYGANEKAMQTMDEASSKVVGMVLNG